MTNTIFALGSRALQAKKNEFHDSLLEAKAAEKSALTRHGRIILNEKVRTRGHDQIPTFGLLKQLTAMRIGNYIDQLIDDGALVRTDGEYPVLVLNEASAEVLRGGREVELRAPKGGLDQPARRRRQGGAAVEARSLTPPEIELFDRLRALRREIASSLGVPPYVVFSDVTLEEFARNRPRSRAAMLDCKGVGPKKFDSFGARFLAALADE